MEGRLAGPPISGATDGLAIQRDHRCPLFWRGAGDQLPGESEQSGLKLGGVEPGEDATKGVVGRNPDRQYEPLLEPIAFGPAPALDLDHRVAAAEGATDGDSQDIEQAVPTSAGKPRINQIDKAGGKAASRVRGHTRDYGRGTPGNATAILGVWSVSSRFAPLVIA